MLEAQKVSPSSGFLRPVFYDAIQSPTSSVKLDAGSMNRWDIRSSSQLEAAGQTRSVPTSGECLDMSHVCHAHCVLSNLTSNELGVLCTTIKGVQRQPVRAAEVTDPGVRQIVKETDEFMKDRQPSPLVMPLPQGSALITSTTGSRSAEEWTVVFDSAFCQPKQR